MAFVKKILKSIDVAFSIYSKIPMPRFAWGTEDMKYHLIFFPWVGLVIGGLEWAWNWCAMRYGWGDTFRLLIALAIPLIVTGGFHVDGFLDTMDALHSYQDRERKLEILKDPHIGAFSIICLVIYLLLLGGFASLIQGEKWIAIGCLIFFLARCLSGISVVTFPSAKKDGMLHTSITTAQRRIVCVSLYVQFAMGMIGILLLSWQMFLVMDVVSAAVFLYYWWMSRKQFGGITGDLCGWFVTVYELVAVMAIGIAELQGVLR